MADFEFRFYGSVQNTKNLYKNNESIKAKSFELGYKVYAKNKGKFINSERKNTYTLDPQVFYQFGTSVGPFQVIPLGLSWNAMSVSDFNIYVFHYNVGVAYKKEINDFGIMAKALYNIPVKSAVDDYEVDYKPKGFTAEVILNYSISDKFDANFKTRYISQKDKDIDFKKGNSFLLGCSYKF